MSLSVRDLKIKKKLEELSSKDELFYTRHNANDFAKMFNTTNNSVYDLFYRLNISLREKREKEFLQYFYNRDIKNITLNQIKEDFKLKNKQVATNKIIKFFGMSLREMKKEIR